METGHFKLNWRGALIIVLVSAAAGLVYNSFGGIPLVAPIDTARRALGLGLPSDDGIHLIGLDAAREYIRQGRGPVVDARSPEQYGQGHIPGALNCFVYELETFLPPLLEKAPLDQPVMIYCTGEDCEDSRFLAQTMQELGYRLLYVFEGGFEGWNAAGLPVETGPAEGAPLADRSSLKRMLDFSRSVPAWAWLSGEIVLLVFGLWVIVVLVRGSGDGIVPEVALRLVGLVFVLASLHKISAPDQFARIVDNYRILPAVLVNITAVVMPWVEMICGIFLLRGAFRGAASLVLAALTVLFIAAISFNVVRGVEFDCGCFGSGHTPPWRILLRDFGLLMCCLPGLMRRSREEAQNRG